MDSLKSLVGLAKASDECDANTPPAGYSDSLSGYFIASGSDGLPIIYVRLGAGSDSISTWDILQDSLDDAVNDFETDFGAKISEEHRSSLTEWTGLIGQPKNDGPLFNYDQNGYSGVTYEMNAIKGAYYFINRVSFHSASQNDNLNFYIVDETGIVWDNFSLQAVANQSVTHSFPEPLKLPLTDENGIAKKYAIVYDHSGSTGSPKAIKIRAQCCGSPMPQPYLRYCNIHGVTGVGDIDEVFEQTSKTKLTYGISVSGDFQCSFTDWLSGEVKPNLSSYMRVISKTIQLSAQVFTIQKILDTNKINRFTVLSRENLYGKRNHNLKGVRDRLEWLKNHIPYERTDCITCNTRRGRSISRRSNLV